MGYIKVKKASGFDLVSADNVGDVKEDTGDVVVQYLSGYKVTIAATSPLVQADVDKVVAAIDVMNGASGVAPLTVLSYNVTGATMTAIS
jgi:hypothetical protein